MAEIFNFLNSEKREERKGIKVCKIKYPKPHISYRGLDIYYRIYGTNKKSRVTHMSQTFPMKKESLKPLHIPAGPESLVNYFQKGALSNSGTKPWYVDTRPNSQKLFPNI